MKLRPRRSRKPLESFNPTCFLKKLKCLVSPLGRKVEGEISSLKRGDKIGQIGDSSWRVTETWWGWGGWGVRPRKSPGNTTGRRPEPTDARTCAGSSTLAFRNLSDTDPTLVWGAVVHLRRVSGSPPQAVKEVPPSCEGLVC